MKKFFIFLCAVIVLASTVVPLLQPCLKAEKDIYPVGTTEITAVFKNMRRYSGGHKYTLERSDGDDWLKVGEEAFFNDGGFTLGCRREITFDLTKYCDGLTVGRYRIGVALTDDRGDERLIFCTFEVR